MTASKIGFRSVAMAPGWTGHDSLRQASAHDRHGLAHPGLALKTYRWFTDPVFIGACLLYAANRLLGLRAQDRPPRWSEIGIHLVVWSILFEVIGPNPLTVHRDFLDIQAYAAGGLAAGLWWNRPALQSMACR